MSGKIFVCHQCHRGYYYPEAKGKDETCDESPLTILEDYEEFECPSCHRKFDVLTLIIMGDTEAIPQGLVYCNVDNSELQWVPFEDTEGVLDQTYEEDKSAWKEIAKKEFEEQVIRDEELEAEIMAAVLNSKKERTKRAVYSLESLGIKAMSPEELETIPKRQRMGRKEKVVVKVITEPIISSELSTKTPSIEVPSIINEEITTEICFPRNNC